MKFQDLRDTRSEPTPVETEPGTWVEIEEGNEWESIFYTYAGEHLRGGTNDTSAALRLEAGALIEVMFPDGQVTTQPLAMRTQNTSYGDMGHTHSVTQRRFGVEIETHGTTVFVPLNKLRIRKGTVPRKKDTP